MDSTGDLQILVTENTEYHISGTTCVGVRDTRTGNWDIAHQAIGAELLGSCQCRPDGVSTVTGAIDLGQRLYFEGNILTSPITRVVAPALMAGERARGIEAA